MTTNEKLDALDALIKDILEDAKKTKGQYTEKTCPLEARDHYKLSELLDGLGCWSWECPFCGTEFQE